MIDYPCKKIYEDFVECTKIRYEFIKEIGNKLDSKTIDSSKGKKANTSTMERTQLLNDLWKREAELHKECWQILQKYQECRKQTGN